MTRAGPWALLLLYLLPSAEGRAPLAPPQNVTLLSRNFGVYLTWLPGPGNPQNVTYRVAYQRASSPASFPAWQARQPLPTQRYLKMPTASPSLHTDGNHGRVSSGRVS